MVVQKGLQLELFQSDEISKKDKDAKKKRNNLPYETFDGNVDESQLDSLSKNKKNNRITDLPAENSEQCGLELKDKSKLVKKYIVADSAWENTSNIQPKEKKVESKKKRKKDGLMSSPEKPLNAEVLDRENQSSTDLTNASLETSKGLVYKNNNDSKKRKRLQSEENKNQPMEEFPAEEFKCTRIVQI